jgi:hypothetical protein
MFTTVALILRPDEIRLFIVLFGAFVSAALAAVVRALRRMLARTVAFGRQADSGRLASGLSALITSDVAVAVSREARLASGSIASGLRRLTRRRMRGYPLRPPH